MADEPFAGQHYADTSVAVDVSDLIYQISPQSTPFMQMAGQGSSSGVLHEWQRRDLVTYQDNAAIEGFIYTFTQQMRLPARLYNVNQILQGQIRVSETQQAINHYAIGDPFADQMSLRLAEHATDIEKALMTSTIATGLTNAARRMSGIQQAIFSGITTYTTYAGATMSETIFNDHVAYLWNLGAEARDCLVGGYHKRKISSFTSSNTHFLKAEERRVIASISIYETDFFPVEIHLSRTVARTPAASNATNQTGHALIFIDRSFLKTAYLRRSSAKRTSEVADSMDGVIKTEATLEYGHPNAHMLVSNQN